ncbi:hypothetical protein HII31_02095 [Pseudocercospora fuligena]|uniref:Uncharacterized protein n=1 Tax=Pseudocercospora fuligena TaxID=685502 RepID=A0A8H6RRQ6_9PEZI|nr:hypothetical protein HII31_02095 [Pseudocercospora fuligena]
MYSQHGQNGYGPPPAKRAKGNPIITRYPPPPGYKGPNQPGLPYAPPPTWQSHGYGQPPTGYHPTAYAQPQYQPQQPSYPQSQHTPHNGLHTNGYFPTQQSSWQPTITTPQSAPSSWHPPPSNFPRNARRHNSAPFPSTRQRALDGNGDPLPPEDSAASSGNGLEAGFDEECYFGRYPDEIIPDLSLGSITWKAPLPAKRALPGTFKEAELEALAPRVDEPSMDDSVSEYISKRQGEEALLSVRQTEYWADMRDDLIFREFPQVCASLVSLAELLSTWRNRYDPNWTERPPTPELSRPSSRASSTASQMKLDEGGILDDLEAALQNGNRASMPPEQKRSHSRASSVSSHHSRAGSVHSHHRRQSSNVSRHKPLPPIRDQGQEDILAALGVTGSPKLVYETPGPAFGPRPTSAAGSEKSAHSRSNSITSAHGANGLKGNALDFIPEVVINEDMEPDDMATPRPKKPYTGDANRKRSYADTGPGAHEDFDDEETPRQKGKHARML